MRISDWSSDVCSSDLGGGRAHPRRSGVPDRAIARDRGSGPQAGADPPHDPQNRTGMACPCIDPCPRISIIALNQGRSEEHTSELQSLMRISYAVFCLKKKKEKHKKNRTTHE